MAEQCGRCSTEMNVIRGDYRLTESCLANVVLQNIEIAVCPQCGNREPIIPYLDEVMRSLVQTVLLQSSRLTGQQVRFLRTYLGHSAEDFARYLHVDKSTISRWENGSQAIGEQSDLLIRMVVMAQGEDLRFIQTALEHFKDTVPFEEARDIQIQIAPETMKGQSA